MTESEPQMEKLHDLLSGRPRVAFAALAAVLGVLFATHSVSGQMEKNRALESAVAAGMPNEVFLEDLTWAEVDALKKSGFDRVLIPTGGTEQNGFHMVLGKHNFIVRHTAGEIARRVGKTLVAPVMAYVPEGRISPAEGHMRFAGTLSLPNPVFEAVLEHTARSLKAHGFKHIFFLGDSGGNQKPQARVAKKLRMEWQAEGVNVHSLDKYYAGNGQQDHPAMKLEGRSFGGSHAGIRDTSELLFVRERGVRRYALDRIDALPRGYKVSGSAGAPEKASRTIGREMVDLKIRAATSQMRGLLGQPRKTAQAS